MKIKILLADDHKIFRDGLRALIDREDNMEVIGEAENGRTALAMARKLKPDIIIMDISMPDMNGIEAARLLLAEMPNMKIIALSMHSDHRYVSGMIEAGASGYLLKDCDFEELVRAVRQVVLNKLYLSPDVTGVVVSAYKSKSSASGQTSVPTLTSRERELLQLFAEGMKTSRIAAHLNISVKTVETHRRNIMEKLNFSSNAELIKYAIREGFTSIDR